MRRYCVNATVTFAAWVYVEADSPQEAMSEAEGMSAGDFEYDSSTGTVEFNVSPAVEPA